MCQGNIHGILLNQRDFIKSTMIFSDYNSSGIYKFYKSLLLYITAV